MKLIPFLRFGGSHAAGDEVPNAPLPLDPLEAPTDEEQQEEEEEEKPEEERPAEEPSRGSDDEMLKVFMSVDEEFVDNSGLTADMEDIPAQELLEEARALGRALGVRVVYEEEQAV
ncbi:MAG: hypothetical protein ABSG55_03830 [Dehalococcoidia bacterium]|jgi:hypothetical protein